LIFINKFILTMFTVNLIKTKLTAAVSRECKVKLTGREERLLDVTDSEQAVVAASVAWLVAPQQLDLPS